MQNEIIVSFSVSTRNVSGLISLANAFKSTILITKGDRTVNAASILGILSLCIMSGDRLVVSALGTSEGQAKRDIKAYTLKLMSM